MKGGEKKRRRGPTHIALLIFLSPVEKGFRITPFLVSPVYVQIESDLSEPLLQFLFDETERRPMTVSELNAEVRAAVERSLRPFGSRARSLILRRRRRGIGILISTTARRRSRRFAGRGKIFRIRFRPQNGVCGAYSRADQFLRGSRRDADRCRIARTVGRRRFAAAYEQIKAKLDAEGLFAEEIKRPIPFFPRKVGVITSPTGAAYHDIHNVLTRRARSVSILLIPTLVQGEGAADSIRQAVNDVNEYNRTLPAGEKIDVLIVGRGGGSAEDLWAFNDEMLARAIRASEIPVISAVGHEIDCNDSRSCRRSAGPDAFGGG